MKLALTPGLTHVREPEIERQIGKTHAGMAHWAGTGPLGATCGDCKHLGCFKQIIDKKTGTIKRTQRINACARFARLTGRTGPVIPSNTESCRHFSPRDGK